MSRRVLDITPDLLLRAYRAGMFPMAESRDAARLFWLDPEQRGVMPLETFHLPRRLRRTVLSGRYRVTADSAFPAVIAACAAAAPGRDDTWINSHIEALFIALHHMGHAHSVEVWGGAALVGGLYGLALGGAFFGESMFTRARDASKVALVQLVARLRLGGFTLLDTQFLTAHLAQFGTEEVARETYKQRLQAALTVPAQWLPSPDDATLRGASGACARA